MPISPFLSAAYAPQRKGLLGDILNNPNLGPGLLGLGQGLLAASGPSRTPVSLGQALGQGALGTQQAIQQKEDQDMRKSLLGLRKREIEAKESGLLNQKRNIVEGADGFKYYEDTGERVLPHVEAQQKPEDLVTTLDDQGNPIYARKSEAIGMPAYKAPLVKVDNSKSEPPYDIPKGFMLKNPNDFTEGVVPIPGSAKDSSTPEQAGKTQMLRNAQNALIDVEALLFNEDGSINQMNVMNASTNTPFTDGRRMRAFMEQGIQAITRAETGAAMPETEVDNTRVRFQPSPLDDDATKVAKFEMFKEFLGGSLNLIDPQGRFQEDRFNKELERRGGKVSEPTVKKGHKEGGYTFMGGDPSNQDNWRKD